MGEHWPFAGCPVADGYGVLIEIFYNPDGIRRFGSLLFGDEVFGDSSGGGVDRWVDVTPDAFDLEIVRGQPDPDVNVPTDELRLAVLDPAGTFQSWTPPESLSSPQIADPIRVSLIDLAGTAHPFVTAHIDSVSEVHGGDNPERRIEIVAFGNKTDLVTAIIDVDRPAETTAERIDWVLDQIDFVGDVEPYPPVFSTRDLAADPGSIERPIASSVALVMIQEAAVSAGFYVATDALGAIIWREISWLIPGIPGDEIISDCTDTGEDVTYINAEYVADTSAVLNTVQLFNRAVKNEDVEAVNSISVSQWGRRSRGYGFPLSVVNSKQTDAQQIADDFLLLSANIVDHVRQLTFDTLTDARWWALLTDIELDRHFTVRRTEPNGVEDFSCSVIGLTLRVLPFAGVSGTLNLTTSTPTLQ